MHVLAAALFDRPAFETCVSHGIVLGSDGQKMSKSLRNYPDVREVFDRDGADAMRWFLMSSPILRGGNLIVTEQGIRDGVRQVIIPLWNAWSFFALYANTANDGAGYEAKFSTASTDVLDRYLLATLREFVEDMTTALDGYEIANACDTMLRFLDVLTNWYIRRSRNRFWVGKGENSEAAFDTLYTCLEVVSRTVAPLLPLITETLYRGLTGERSVHLTDWPDAGLLPADPAGVAAMDRVREVCSVASSLRKAAGLRARLPLAKLTVVTNDPAALEGLADIIGDEVNVKEVVFVAADSPEAEQFGVSQRLTVNARAAGPRLGRDVQTVIKGSKSGDWSVAEDGTVTCAGMPLEEGEYVLEAVADGAGTDSQSTGMLPSGGFVVLDTEVTPELAREGIANDLIRAVQQARREAGLHVSDRISLTVIGGDEVFDATLTHRDRLVAETLATQFGSAPALEAVPADGTVSEVTVGDGHVARIKVSKATGGDDR